MNLFEQFYFADVSISRFVCVVEESGTVKEILEAKYFLFFDLPEQIFVRYFYFCCLFLPEMKEIYPFFYYASTMAEKRGASSSQK